MTKNCSQCNKTYTPSRTSCRRNKNFFCTKVCYWSSLKKQEKLCLACNKSFYRHYKSDYCSTLCFSSTRKGKVGLTGEKSGNWKGGISKDNTHYCNIRRSKLVGAEGSFTQSEWENLKEKLGFMCACCKRAEPEIKLTRDHIIPLSKGGSNYISNIQPLCASCNSRKHDKYIDFISNFQLK